MHLIISVLAVAGVQWLSSVWTSSFKLSRLTPVLAAAIDIAVYIAKKVKSVHHMHMAKDAKGLPK